MILGLGCAGKTDCGCGCNKGLGEVDIYGASWCGDWPWSMFCSDEAVKQANMTAVERVITDTSDYGGHLSLEARTLAEQMARNTVAADSRCNYSEINSMGWIEKLIRCDLLGSGGGSSPNWLAIGALAFAGFVVLKKV